MVGAGRPTVTDLLTDALLKHLDTNADGRVEEAEWKAAEGTLTGSSTANDDELIGPGELVANAVYPGALGSTLVKPPAPDAALSPVAEALPFLVLPPSDAVTDWIGAAAARREAAREAPGSHPNRSRRRRRPLHGSSA